MRFATLGRSRGEAAASCEREPERAHGERVVVQKVCTALASPGCARAAGCPPLFVSRHGPPALIVASCVVGHSGYGAPHAAIVCARQTGNNACKRTPAGIIHRFPERRTIVLASCVRPTSSPPVPYSPYRFQTSRAHVSRVRIVAHADDCLLLPSLLIEWLEAWLKEVYRTGEKSD